MDWLSLLLLIPLVIIPVVFLTGFAGCNFVFGLEETDPVPDPPSDLRARAFGTDRIELTWTDNSILTTHIRINRYEGGSTVTIEESLPATPGVPPIPYSYVDDSGLKEATTYEYQVFLLPSGFMLGSNIASATTLSWKTAFAAEFSTNQPNWTDNCMVQRINAAGNLFNSGTKVRITLRGSTNTALRIKKAYISQTQNPLGGGANAEVDSLAGDLTQLKFGGNDGHLLLAGVSVLSDETDYSFDQDKDLILAFDIGTNPEDGARHGPKIGCRAFRSATNDQAGKVDGDRSNFQLESADTVYLVEKIEVLLIPV